MDTHTRIEPDCPTWCDGRHPRYLSLTDPSIEAGWVVTHHRSLADVEHLTGVELVQDEPHPDMRIEDGMADPDDFPAGPRLVFWTEHSDLDVTPTRLRTLAAALVEAADAAESWGLR